MYHVILCAVLDEIVDTLAELDIAVEQVHAEAGTGQFEIVTTFAEPLEVSNSLYVTSMSIAANVACMLCAACCAAIC